MAFEIDVTETLAGFDVLTERINAATRGIVDDGLHLIQVKAMANAPVGVEGNSTNPPGDLSRSIEVDGPHGGDGLWEGKVGPTIVYGRQRELGGPIFPVNVRSLHFWTFGEEVFTRRVYQKPEPYLGPAEQEMIPAIRAVANERIAAAIQEV